MLLIAAIVLVVTICGFWIAVNKRPIRLWLVMEYSIASLVAAASIVVIVVLVAIGFGLPATAVVGACAAILAVFSLAINTVNNLWSFNRARRVDTIKAWESWNKECGSAPAAVAQAYGPEPLTQDAAEELSTIRLAVLRGDDLDTIDRQKLRAISSLTDYLNGLERLSAGASVGAYDEALIRVLGATRIALVSLRYGEYIEYRRSQAPDANSKAYDELLGLVRRVNDDKGRRLVNPDVKRVEASRPSDSLLPRN